MERAGGTSFRYHQKAVSAIAVGSGRSRLAERDLDVVLGAILRRLLRQQLLFERHLVLIECDQDLLAIRRQRMTIKRQRHNWFPADNDGASALTVADSLFAVRLDGPTRLSVGRY